MDKEIAVYVWRVAEACIYLGLIALLCWFTFHLIKGIFGILKSILSSFKMLLSKVTSILSNFICGLLSAFASAGTFWFLVNRGKLTVRAAGYLLSLEDGMSQYDANRFAFSIDTYAASKRKHEVMFCVQQAYGGSRSALISNARFMGFLG